ncbi:MAG: hypothetical protein JXA57_01635, partial [Armatimonadetes bacterium]|nr:hypothetical protein [Armatimonadota bacterium]
PSNGSRRSLAADRVMTRDELVAWLLEGDPAIRRQVMRDLSLYNGRWTFTTHDLYLSAGKPIKPGWTSFSFPPYWFYDVLTVLDHLRAWGTAPDPRMWKAVELVEHWWRS